MSVLPEKLDSALELVAECIKFKLKPQYLVNTQSHYESDYLRLIFVYGVYKLLQVKEAKQIAQVSYDKYASNPVEQVTEVYINSIYLN